MFEFIKGSLKYQTKKFMILLNAKAQFWVK